MRDTNAFALYLLPFIHGGLWKEQVQAQNITKAAPGTVTGTVTHVPSSRTWEVDQGIHDQT